MSRRFLPSVLGFLAILACNESVATQVLHSTEEDASLSADPRVWLSRARTAIGLTQLGDLVVHTHTETAALQNYQSDRTYPPFFSAMISGESWFDPQVASLRVAKNTAGRWCRQACSICYFPG
jgi:hypothetical protein